MKPNKIAVIGGTGKSGKYLVKALLAQNYPIKMLIRNPENASVYNSLAEIITGNAADYSSIYRLLQGCDAVISTLGLGIPSSEPTIFSTATGHIIKAMESLGITRYIVTAGLNVDVPSDRKSIAVKSATDWMYANYPISTKDRQLEFDLLIESNINWTMVRLPMITLTDDVKKTSVNLNDCPGNSISAASLARFLIHQLDKDDFIKKAPFIADK